MLLFTIYRFTICYIGGREGNDDIGHNIDDLCVDTTATTVRGLAVIPDDLTTKQEGDVLL
jgi:hypothetical protein